jgi:co-chaperonin GroES (HSP10)
MPLHTMSKTARTHQKGRVIAVGKDAKEKQKKEC